MEEVTLTLWSAQEEPRYFLLPSDYVPPAGNFTIRTPAGEERSVEADILVPFEVTERQAMACAKEELGDTLDELKQNIDEKLADWRRQLDEFNRLPITQKSTVTPEAASVFFDFLKQLPGIFRESVSGDEERVDSARKATADLASRFKESGLEVDDRLECFPDRLVKVKEKTDS